MRAWLVLFSFIPLAATADWVTDGGSGCSALVEYPSAAEKMAWAGPCENGKAHGVGILTSSNGTRIEGEFRGGRPYNARGREPLLVLSDGRRPVVDVTYVAGMGTRYGTQLKQKSAAEVSSYATLIASAIRKNIVHGPPIEGNPMAVVNVRVDRQGKILSAALVTSSGVQSWDEAVMKALERTGSLPLDIDQTIPPRLELAFRPH